MVVPIFRGADFSRLWRCKFCGVIAAVTISGAPARVGAPKPTSAPLPTYRGFFFGERILDARDGEQPSDDAALLSYESNPFRDEHQDQERLAPEPT